MKIEFDLHRAGVLIDIVRDPCDGSVVATFRIGRHSERNLLAFANPATSGFRHRNDDTKATYAFDSDDGLCARLPRCCRPHERARMQVPAGSPHRQTGRGFQVGLQLRYAAQAVACRQHIAGCDLHLRIVGGSHLLRDEKIVARDDTRRLRSPLQV